MPKLGMEPTRRAEVIIPDDRSGNCKHHDSQDMLDVTLKYILPPARNDTGEQINVSQLDGIEKMHIPYSAQGRLFIQFFRKLSWTVIYRKLCPAVIWLMSMHRKDL